MSTPVLHLLVGCNGAGKSTLADLLLENPDFAGSFPFINADVIGAQRWPDDTAKQQAAAYELSQEAARLRAEMLASRRSFMTETVFSHESKVGLVHDALRLGYQVWLSVVAIPEDLAVERVLDRVDAGGHPVPESKIRGRYRRLWSNVARVVPHVDQAVVYDNSSIEHAMREVARFDRGREVRPATWPSWAPAELVALSAGRP